MAAVAKKLSPDLGALIDGLDPFRIIDPEQQLILRCLLQEHKVLVFDGSTWGPTEILRIAQAFGRLPDSLWTARTHSATRSVEIVESSSASTGKANVWHTDSTWKQVPPAGAVLQCEIAPPYGGDTIWVSMAHVFARLSTRLQEYVLGLEAVHTLAQSPGFQEKFLTPHGQSDYSEILRANPPVLHPVVIRHPVSEISTLFVNAAYCQRILGVPSAESEMIMLHIRNLMAKPEHHFRLSWKPGVVAIWDNCATQHYAVNDYAPHRRRMNRVAFEFSDSVKELAGATNASVSMPVKS